MSSVLPEFCTVAGLPVVQFNRYSSFNDANAVHCDNVAGGRLAAEMLMDTGHARLSYVAGIEDTSSNVDREKASWLRCRIEAKLYSRAAGHYSYAGGAAAAHALLARDDRPDAIFCANDMMALGVIDVATSAFAIAIPDVLSVIGFDNVPLAVLDRYALTTIDQNLELMAHEAVDLIIREGPAGLTERRVVPVRLLRRGTVKEARSS